MISDVPWGGPVGAVRVGRINGQFVVNPSTTEQENSDLDLRIAGTRDAILMVECGAMEIPEAVMVEALNFGHQSIQPLIDIQEQMAQEIGKPKQTYPPFILAEAIQNPVNERASARLNEALDAPHTKAELDASISALQQEIVTEMTAQDEALASSVIEAMNVTLKNVVWQRILERQVRPDGRGLTEIRPIWGEVGISPRAHGSGLFTRGETQVLTLATLGTPRDAQEIDSLTGTEAKRYMHHYNFPPFSTGEVRPLRGSSRREVGHGALAERALLPVIPSETDFPYTLRLVSEVLSSNGSTSMASVCGSTLALMDTGVPIKAPVAGVAMGLIKEGDRYFILTDIQGMEDHLGDMDFKVAGTREGITALQMDIKIKGITSEIMSKALEQARVARMSILDKILEIIPEPRKELKSFAPRITVLHIPSDKIGAVIGPGGKVIRSIQDETGVKIDIEEDGTVYIAATDGPAAMRAREMVEQITEVPVVGRIYTGRVVRTTDFGAFVEILPNQDGLVHISQLDSERVNKVEDVVSVGDEITVMITNIDSTGKVRLSRQAVLEGWTLEEALAHDRPSGGRSGGSRGGGGGGDRRRPSRNGGNRDRRDRR
jgi:polyribonucleotide nucleotidyltransferase